MIKFISKQTRDDFPFSQVTENEIEYTVKSVALSRDELLDEFMHFMKAIGYQFKTEEYLDVVSDEQEEIFSDDEESITLGDNVIALDCGAGDLSFGSYDDVTYTVDDSDVDFSDFTISVDTQDKTHKVFLTEVELEDDDNELSYTSKVQDKTGN